MISEEDIIKYQSRLVMQLDGLKNLDIDPHDDENAVDHQRMISYLEGQLKAVNRILNVPEEPVKIITFIMTGTSDDLIELDGDINDELGAYDVVRGFYLSDGTAGTIEYTDGVWRINILVHGEVKVIIVHPTQKDIDEDINYTDKATFTGPVEWIIFDNGQIFKPG